MRRKPKPYIEFQLRQLLPKFCRQLCLEKVPYMTFSRAEVKRLGIGRYSNLGRRYWGMAWHKENVIYISPRHNAVEHARDTLAHEAIHLRFDYLSHGKDFDNKIALLLKGEQFKPKRLLVKA